MNRNLVFERKEEAIRSYADAVKKGGKATDCIQCRKCERACPQHLTIVDYLKDCAATLEPGA